MTEEISNRDDVISFSDITDRVEELESLLEDRGVRTDLDTSEPVAEDGEDLTDKTEELAKLTSVLDETRGYGGDHQWRGDWYPGTLIRHTYFTDYCKDLVEDIGDLPNGIPSYIAIDWEKTAENLKVDYSTVDFDGVEYYYR